LAVAVAVAVRPAADRRRQFWRVVTGFSQEQASDISDMNCFNTPVQ